MSCKPRIQSKIISCLQIAIGGGLSFIAVNLYNGNEYFLKTCVMPAFHTFLSPELSHALAVKCVRFGLTPSFSVNEEDSTLLKSSVLGLKFTNPIGLAAGFDKNGEAVWGLSRLGFGFIEVGSVTPHPQPGNEKPRVFRLTEDEAIINRYGFNNKGFWWVYKNVRRQWFLRRRTGVIVGINLGKNKDTLNPVEDYTNGLIKFAPNDNVHYYTINISSPNTPGLRNLQKGEELKNLIGKCLETKVKNGLKKPLLVKIAPDLTYEEKAAIANIVLNEQRAGVKVDGLIVSNTTVQRPSSLKSSEKLISETGGLSGKPLKDLSTQAIRDMYKLTRGQIPIIGVGGVFTGEDAFEKIKAGASLIQIYSALVYEGPSVVVKINHELAELLRKNGYSNIKEAIGKE